MGKNINQYRSVRIANRLTALKVSKTQKQGLYADGGGLYLSVAKSGSKSWLFRYSLAGRARYHGLGASHTISLYEAREASLACRKLLMQGIDPIDHKKHIRRQKSLNDARNLTFADCADKYIASHQASWKNIKHAQQWRNTLKDYAYPFIATVPIADISVDMIMRIIQPIWATKNETASRVRGRIEVILDWAKAYGMRDGENPARWRGNLEHLLPARKKVNQEKHHCAMPYSELPAFWHKLQKHNSHASLALQLLILTATRTNEVLGTKWHEIDIEKRIWCIPASRMKASKAHRIPLSDSAIAILMQAKTIRQGDYIFTGQISTKPLSNMTMIMLIRRMGYPNITVHGFRSSFRDYIAEQTNYPREVAESALAHSLGSKVELAYLRSDLFDKRIKMMNEWASFVNAEYS